MVNAIFKEDVLQKQFEADGFVKITLLTHDDTEALKTLFAQYFPNPSADFFSSSYENDYLRKKEISEAIGNILLPRLEKVFTGYSWFGSAFLSKGNGARSEMPMHQDWTIVDETQFVALNIWTPLQDTNEENGTLEVIRGSHRWHSELRAPTLPFYYNGFQQGLKDHLTCIPVKATEAVVLNQAVIHYSKPNKTNEIRLALTTGIKSEGAPMLFHYWNKEKPDEIEQFKQEDDFLLRFTDFHQAIFQRPVTGESMGTKAFQLKTATAEEMDQLNNKVAGPVEQARLSFAQKLKRWIRA